MYNRMFSVGAFAAGSGGDYLFSPRWIASCQLRSGETYAVVDDGGDDQRFLSRRNQ